MFALSAKGKMRLAPSLFSHAFIEFVGERALKNKLTFFPSHPTLLHASRLIRHPRLLSVASAKFPLLPRDLSISSSFHFLWLMFTHK